MLGASDGVNSELTLEKEESRLSESVKNKRGEKDVEELSDGVVSRQVFRILPENRCGNGAVFRFPGGLLLLGGAERGTSVTGFEVELGLWKAFEQETGARIDERSRTIFVGWEYLRTIRDGRGARYGITVMAAVAACDCNLGDPLERVSSRTFK